MTVNVRIKIKDENYYVVAMPSGIDAINDFFEFTITVRHDRLKLNQLVPLTAVLLEIEDDKYGGLLAYDCEIQGIKRHRIRSAQQGGEEPEQVELTLRPMGWSVMSRNQVRVFEVGSDTEDLLNIRFESKPTLEQLERLLNQALFGADSGFVELASGTVISDYRLDLWQNQLAIQLHESNGDLLKRLTWKLGASFFYDTSADSHLWIVVPDACAVPENRQKINEDQLSKLECDIQSLNHFDRWYQDQLSQVSYQLPANAHLISLEKTQQTDSYQVSSLTTSVTVGIGHVSEYLPSRREQPSFVWMPIKVNHFFDHRTGYHCNADCLHQQPNGTFNLAIFDEPPQPFLTPILATIAGPEGKAFGSRDKHMRYFVHLDYKMNVDDQVTMPRAWLYRLRPDAALNGSGQYYPLPLGTKVVLQMLNGDREQAVITDTFITKPLRPLK